MRIAVYSRGLDAEQFEGLKLLMKEFELYQIESLFYQDFFNQIYSSVEIKNKFCTFNSREDLENIDFVISLGGDGTLLDTITFIGDKNIPVLGINYGRLGFLAGIGREEIHIAIESLVKRTFILDKRSLVHLDANMPLFEGVPFGLNEFTIHKKDISPMIKIHAYLNGEFLNTYWADGLIVSTPTGSTGYSLSCGGPIVFPDSKSFVITPVSPHNLNVRPLVVPDDSIISFEVEGRTDGFLCTLDSRREIVSKEVLLAIRKENFYVNLIRVDEANFLQTLRNKLSWGLDKRN